MPYMIKNVIALYNVQLINAYNDKTKQTEKEHKENIFVLKTTTYNLWGYSSDFLGKRQAMIYHLAEELVR